MKYLQLLRIKHWAKNTFIFLPLFFAGEFYEVNKLVDLSAGFFLFGLVASSIYIINDYRDIAADQQHPIKQFRPLASGAVTKNAALIIFFVLFMTGFSGAIILKPKFAFILCIYFIMNLAYTFGLKKISILDVILVAAGFVLRVKAGGALGIVHVSSWLTMMIFLLALFMAFAKRRDDVLIKLSSGKDIRKSAKGYNLEFLNVAISLLSAITIVAYLMYCVTPEVMQRLSYRIYYTTLFVIAGILRYLQICFVENNTSSPTEILYRDRFIQMCIALWVISFYVIIYFPDTKIFQE